MKRQSSAMPATWMVKAIPEELPPRNRERPLADWGSRCHPASALSIDRHIGWRDSRSGSLAESRSGSRRVRSICPLARRGSSRSASCPDRPPSQRGTTGSPCRTWRCGAATCSSPSRSRRPVVPAACRRPEASSRHPTRDDALHSFRHQLPMFAFVLSFRAQQDGAAIGVPRPGSMSPTTNYISLSPEISANRSIPGPGMSTALS